MVSTRSNCTMHISLYIRLLLDYLDTWVKGPTSSCLADPTSQATFFGVPSPHKYSTASRGWRRGHRAYDCNAPSPTRRVPLLLRLAGPLREVVHNAFSDFSVALVWSANISLPPVSAAPAPSLHRPRWRSPTSPGRPAGCGKRFLTFLLPVDTSWSSPPQWYVMLGGLVLAGRIMAARPGAGH